MQLTLASRSQNFVRSYDEHGVRIGERTLQQSCLIAPASITPWDAASVIDLGPQSLQPIFALKPEVVILSTGLAQQFPSMAIRSAFMAREVGLEVMALGAACRTFNVLLSEDRHVVLALLQQTAPLRPDNK